MPTPTIFMPAAQVNTGIADVSGVFDPQIIGLSNGNILVTWSEPGTSGVATNGDDDIVGRIYRADGTTVVRNTFQINTERTAHSERDYDIAATADGGFVVVYVDNNGDDSGIVWERMDWFGTSLFDRVIVDETNASNDYDNPQVVVDAAGNSTVSYTDRTNSGFTYHDDINAVRLSDDGTVLASEFDIADNDIGEQPGGHIAININGELVSGYRDSTQGEVKIDVIAADGALMHRTVVDTNGDPSDAHVATLANGNIVVTWSDDTDDVNYRVYDQDLNAITPKTSINNTGASQAEVIARPTGGFVVVYREVAGGTENLIAQQYDNNGVADGAAITVASGDISWPQIGITGDDRILFTWDNNDDIFTAIYDPRVGAIVASDYEDNGVQFVNGNGVHATLAGGVLTGDSLTPEALFGSDLDDTINALGGDDTVYGGDGDDVINGGLGDDWLRDDQGNATLNGGGGNDTLTGGYDNDSLLGGSGNDNMYGDEANDTLLGQGGNDYLDGGEGRDTLLGGGGDDALGSVGSDFIDTYDGGSGRDLLNFQSRDSSNTFAFSGAEVNFATGVITASAALGGTGTVTGIEDYWDNGGSNTIIMGDDLRTVITGGGEDTVIAGSSAEQILLTWDGEDHIIDALVADDVTIAAAGAAMVAEPFPRGTILDLSSAATGVSVVFDGTTALTASNGAERSFTGITTFITTDSNDYVVRDTQQNVYAGAGNDTIVSVDLIDGITNGGDGIDTFVNDSGSAAIELYTANFISIERVIGSDSSEIISGDFDANNWLEGNGGNDDIFGIGGENTILGGSGDDELHAHATQHIQAPGTGGSLVSGGVGNDTVFGGVGHDTLNGGTGTDTIEAGGGNDMITGGNDNDSIRGGDGADTVQGGAGVDTIIGDSGADTLEGGAAGDRINGGDGADSINGGSGGDIMTGDNGADTVLGASGSDTIYGNANNDYLLSGSGNDFVRGGTGADYIDGGLGADTMDGDESNDTIFGNAGSDILSGGSGADTLGGQGGNDRLYGDEGADYLFGANGNDTLEGDNGNDTLEGGSGADSFEFNLFGGGSFGSDVIIDFLVNVDQLDFMNFGPVQTMADFNSFATDVGADMVLDFGTFGQITLLGVQESQFDSGDIVFYSI